MRVKSFRYKWLLLLAIGCLPALLYYLYLLRYVIDQESSKFSSSTDSRLLEFRIAQLENGLQANRVFMQQLRDKVNQYSLEVVQRSNGSSFTNVRCKFRSLEDHSSTDYTVEQIYKTIPFDNPNGGVWKQGWPIEINQTRFTDTSPLRVIVVPHSHNDPGWLKTFEQYYKTQTNLILNNLLKKLPNDRRMSFIWAEVSYFAVWYESLRSEDAKETIKLLLDNGQLEFVTGGWVMNDEANTHYFAMISQMVEGHEWLTHHLNYRPKHGWAIDPFGVSPTMAFLLKRMGLRAMVVQRIHYAIKKFLAKSQMLEFYWRQHWESRRPETDILCHVMPFYSYDIPHTCGPDPKVCCQFDFRRLGNPRMGCPWKVAPKPINEQNVASRAQLLLDQYRKKAMLYKTNVLLVPLGDDFRFDKELEWLQQFENYQRIFDHVNRNPNYKVEIKFGTLSDYFDQVFKEEEEGDGKTSKFSSLSGNFFAYADRDDNYWSGFYTTRPFYKRYDRIFESHLRAAELIFSIYSIMNGGKNNLLSNLSPLLTFARQNLALFQHHDAITGTAKDNVVHDYALRMYKGIINCQFIIAAITNSMFYLPMEYPSLSLNNTQIYDWKEPEKRLTFRLDRTLDRWAIFAYNSLAREKVDIFCIDLIVSNFEWILRDFQGKLISEVQINVDNQQGKLSKVLPLEVCFRATLPPLSITQFTLEQSDFDPSYEQANITRIDHNVQDLNSPTDDFSIQNDALVLIFNRADGLLRQLNRLDEGNEIQKFNLRFDFMTYGTRKKTSDHSGAYLFIPDEDEPQDVVYMHPEIKVTRGSLLSRVHLHIDGPIGIDHEITLIKGQPYFDVRNQFHLKRGLFNNKELLMRLYSDIKNEGVFYSDLNSLQMARREYQEKIPLQGNVYPMSSIAYLQDKQHRLNVLTGQPLGVSSHFSGNLDIFLDRLLLFDDQRGLGQGITDNLPTREWFRVLIEPSSQDHMRPSLDAQIFLQDMLYMPIILRSTQQSNQGQLQFFRNELPCDVHFLNFRTNLYSFDEFYAFFHRFASTCETRCTSSAFNLKHLLSQALIDSLDDRIDRKSLSLLYTQDRMNFSTHRIQMPESDFEVIALRLKN